MIPDTTLRDTVSARTRPLCDELMGRGFYGRWSAEFDGPRIRLALEVVRFGDPFGVEHVTWARPRHYRRGNAMVRLLRRALARALSVGDVHDARHEGENAPSQDSSGALVQPGEGVDTPAGEVVEQEAGEQGRLHKIHDTATAQDVLSISPIESPYRAGLLPEGRG